MTFRADRYSPNYPGLRGTGLDDMNIIYGPEGFGSLPEGLANMQGTQGHSL